MRGKSILALAVALAMIFSVIPAFGLTASAANFGEGETSFSIEFTLVGPSNTVATSGHYRDMVITDADGTGLATIVICSAADGVYPFDRDGDSGSSGNLPGVTFETPTGTGSGASQNGFKYTPNETKLKIAVENGDNQYTVTFSTDGYTRTRTYTGRTANGIATPDKWRYTGGGNTGMELQPGNIYNYINDVVIEVGEQTYESVEQTVNYTYNGETIDTFTYTAHEGVKFTVPALKDTAEDGSVVGWYESTQTVQAEGEAIDLPADIVIKDGEVAHYSFADGTAKDETGNFDAEITKPELTVVNGIANFPGGQDVDSAYINLPTEIMKYLDGSFTVSMWINQDSNYEGDSKSIAVWDFAGLPANSNNRLVYTQTGKTFKLLERKTNHGKSLDTELTKDNWALVTAVFDYDDEIEEHITAYINGEKLTFTTDELFNMRTPADVYSEASSPVAYLGHNVWANTDGQEAGNPNLKGGMADVRFYSKALTEDEVKALLDAKHEYKVTYKASDNAELQNAEGQTVTYFTEEGSDVTVEVPATLQTADGKVYAPENGSTTQIVNTDSLEITYVPQPEAVDDVAPVTFISGNDPLLPSIVTLDGKYEAEVEWTTTPLDTLGDNASAELEGTVTAYGKEYDANVTVTKLPCTDDSLADDIKSRQKDGGTVKSAVHQLKTPVADSASVEFDVTFLTEIGSNDVVSLTERGHSDPGFGGGAVIMQGANVNNAPGKDVAGSVSFRDGNGWLDKYFVPVIGEKYRIFATVDTTNDNYDVVVRDKDGNIVIEGTDLAFRVGNVTNIGDLCVLYNNNGEDDEVERTLVSDFRVSWVNDDWKNVKISYQDESGTEIAASEPKLYMIGNTIEVDSHSALYEGKIYKFESEPIKVTAEMEADTVTQIVTVPVKGVVDKEYAVKTVETTKGEETLWPTEGATQYKTVVGCTGNTEGIPATDIKDADGKSIAEGAYGKYNSGDRQVTETFDAPKLNDGEVAILHLAIGGARQNHGGDSATFRTQLTANEKSAYSTGVTDDSNGTKLAPDYLTADITNLLKDAEGEVEIVVASEGAVLLIDEDQAAFGAVHEGYASYIEVKKGVKVTVEGAAPDALITKDGAKMEGAEFYASEGDVVRVYNGAEPESGLVNVTVNDGSEAVSTETTIGAETVTLSVLSAETTELGVTLADGAQVRIGATVDGEIATDSGLRFIGTVEKEGTLAGMDGAEISVDITTEGSDVVVNIPIDLYQDGDAETGTIFTAVLTNLKPGNYNRKFKATPVVTINGEKFTDSEASVERSIYEVAAGILVNGEPDADVEGKEYALDDTVKTVLNAYVNAVGVRFSWNADGFVAGDSEIEKYYAFGNEENKTIFFNVEATSDDKGVYTITVTPKKNVVIDTETLIDTIRINNNNNKVAQAITEITADEKGVVTFKFDPEKAKAAK